MKREKSGIEYVVDVLKQRYETLIFQTELPDDIDRRLQVENAKVFGKAEELDVVHAVAASDAAKEIIAPYVELADRVWQSSAHYQARFENIPILIGIGGSAIIEFGRLINYYYSQGTFSVITSKEAVDIFARGMINAFFIMGLATVGLRILSKKSGNLPLLPRTAFRDYARQRDALFSRIIQAYNQPAG